MVSAPMVPQMIAPMAPAPAPQMQMQMPAPMPMSQAPMQMPAYASGPASQAPMQYAPQPQAYPQQYAVGQTVGPNAGQLWQRQAAAQGQMMAVPQGQTIYGAPPPGIGIDYQHHYVRPSQPSSGNDGIGFGDANQAVSLFSRIRNLVGR
jgi:hypothetical protein